MTELPQPKRPEGCISDLVFDRLFAAELTSAEQRALTEHVERCARCTARRHELEQERAAFLSVAPALKRTNEPQKSPRARWLASTGAALALAAAVLLALLPDGAPDTRSKGSEHIGFFVKRGERVFRGSAGERVRPGDQLRFTYSSSRARHLAILSLDGAQQVSVYFPPGDHAQPMAAGSDTPLPSAVELDGTLGEERIVALFCADAIEVAKLQAMLAAQKAAFVSPPGCVKQELTIVKESTSP